VKALNYRTLRVRVILLGLFFTGCSNSDEEVSKIQASEEPPMQRILHGTFTYSERGNTMHVLKAGEMTRIEGGSAESPEDLVEVRKGMELFIDGDESDHEAHLQAQWASLDEKQLRLVAEHEVILSNRKGDVLETEYLVWAEDSNRVWTNRAVTITSDQGILYGEGLESDGRFENYEIIRPKGEIILEGSEKFN
jgi:LPS export ABC transporter protein LptC